MQAVIPPPFNAASPPPIGNTTPNTGAFTTVSTADNITVASNKGITAGGGTVLVAGGVIALENPFSPYFALLFDTSGGLYPNQAGITLGKSGAGYSSTFKAATTLAALNTLYPTPSTGQEAFITDGLTTTLGITAVGGGTNPLPVFFNGTNWITG